MINNQNDTEKRISSAAYNEWFGASGAVSEK